MTTNPALSQNVNQAIALAAAAITAAPKIADLPTPERMKLHRKTIQSIMFTHGIEGVNQYKLEHPEAASIRLHGGAIAYQPKPEGYDAYLVTMAERWLDSAAARNVTNIADVERLNEKLMTSYPPTKHFSEPLSKGRMKKIKDAYGKRGIPLDTAKVRTMADVRQVAEAVTGTMEADQQFSTVGSISGNTLIANGRTYLIEMNGKRRCIRPTIGGKRCRLYIDELEWIADWLAGGWREPLPDTNTCIIGEAPYPAKSQQINEKPAEPEPENSGLAYRIQKLNERYRVGEHPTNADYPDGDPFDFIDDADWERVMGTKRGHGANFADTAA